MEVTGEQAKGILPLITDAELMTMRYAFAERFHGHYSTNDIMLQWYINNAIMTKEGEVYINSLLERIRARAEESNLQYLKDMGIDADGGTGFSA